MRSQPSAAQMTPSKSGGAPSPRAVSSSTGRRRPKCATVWMLTPSWSTTFRNASEESSRATRTGIGPPPTMWLTSPGCACPAPIGARDPRRSPDPLCVPCRCRCTVRACARTRRRRARRVDSRRRSCSPCATRGRSRCRDGSRTTTPTVGGSAPRKRIMPRSVSPVRELAGRVVARRTVHRDRSPRDATCSARLLTAPQARRARQRRELVFVVGERHDLTRLGERHLARRERSLVAGQASTALSCARAPRGRARSTNPLIAPSNPTCRRTRACGAHHTPPPAPRTAPGPQRMPSRCGRIPRRSRRTPHQCSRRDPTAPTPSRNSTASSRIPASSTSLRPRGSGLERRAMHARLPRRTVDPRMGV